MGYVTVLTEMQPTALYGHVNVLLRCLNSPAICVDQYILLSVWFSESVKYRLRPSVVIPMGVWNNAPAIKPSVVPATAVLPVIVVTAPLEIKILWIVLLNESVTKRFVPSVVIPFG